MTYDNSVLRSITIVFISGGYFLNYHVDTSFLLDLSTMTWRQGPSLPYGLEYMSYVQYQGTMLLAGGNGVVLSTQYAMKLNKKG